MVRNIGVGARDSEKKEIKIGDTALARTITVKKMELNAAVDNFSKEERNGIKPRLAMLDKEEENDLAAVAASLPELPELDTTMETVAIVWSYRTYGKSITNM